MADPVVYRQVEPAQRRIALGLLLTGRVEGADAAVSQFLSFASEQRLDLSELWVAEQRDGRRSRFKAAALVVPCAGRSAILFTSPRAHGDTADNESLRGLVTELVATLKPQRLKLLQALLDEGQRPTEELLASAGFDRLADLAYMQKSCAGRGTRGQDRLNDPAAARETLRRECQAAVSQRIEASIEVDNWQDDLRAVFGEAVLATYEGTLDCPALRGVRPIDDVIDGHLAAGLFHPEWWFLVRARVDGEVKPVAVLLLNHIVARKAMELVYLGVAPGFRGCGLGRVLVEFALRFGADHGELSVLLAVDHANYPALAVYERLGFQATSRKVAMIRPIR